MFLSLNIYIFLIFLQFLNLPKYHGYHGTMFFTTLQVCPHIYQHLNWPHLLLLCNSVPAGQAMTGVTGSGIQCHVCQGSLGACARIGDAGTVLDCGVGVSTCMLGKSSKLYQDNAGLVTIFQMMAGVITVGVGWLVNN